MKSQTVLLATWSDGLFAIGDGGLSHELAKEPVKWVAPDGRGGALLQRAGRAGQSPGALSDWFGRGLGSPGRPLPGAIGRDGGGRAGHPQGGSGLFTA